MLGVLLWFDVEDYVNDETDYALMKLASLLGERGIGASFKLVGEKARVLMERRRNDIARSLARHEIGYHTRLHSEHPTVSEYVEGRSLSDGAREFALREGPGLDDVVRFAGQGVTCYGQAGYSWAPHVFPVLRRWGVPVYLDVHDAVSLNSDLFWYGGILNASGLGETLRMELVPGGLDAAKRSLDGMRESVGGSEWRFVNCYYHPLEFVTETFWDDLNFANGRNPSRSNLKKVSLRPVAERERLLGEFSLFVDYVASRHDVRILTASDLYRMERSRQTLRDEGESRQVAAMVGRRLSWVRNGDLMLAPSEIFQVLREAVGVHKSFGPLYGPDTGGDVTTVASVRFDELVRAVSAEFPRVQGWEQIPARFVVGSGEVNAVDMVLTLAEAVRQQATEHEEVTVVRGTLETEAAVVSTAAWGPRWSIFPDELEVPGIVGLAQQQTWTIRPALV